MSRDRAEADERRRRAAREQALAGREAVRQDMDQPADPGWGTSPGAMGRVKAESEEARMASCPDCGYSSGRHSRTCPRHDADA